MPTTRNKRTTTTRANTARTPLRIQKEINEDYVELARDYKKLALALWKKPATKYILGGLGLAAVTPFLFRTIKGLPGVEAFFTDTFEGVKNKVDHVISSHSADDSMNAH